MTGMTNFLAGDLVLAHVPFSSGTQAKLRAALIVLDTGDADVLIVRVTSQKPQTPYDVVLTEWKQSGLLFPSVARLHKMVTIETSLINRRIGQIQPTDRVAVAAAFRQMFGNW
ncbi:MAG TPA: type II toxin-antitoxin system PemK/MazF family toxin [Gemmataceae bacterium]|jgi:mRNA interferase MazF|nr:type II toxin-antitoxin system PemK/MazF family toxin [Gemmataceae bacterium]